MKMRTCQAILLIFFCVGLCWVIRGDEPQTELDALKAKIMERKQQKNPVYGNYKLELFNNPFEKHMATEEQPLKAGSFIDKMYYDKVSHRPCLSLMINYVKDKKNPEIKQQSIVAFLLNNMVPYCTSETPNKVTSDIILNCFNNPTNYNDESRKIIKNYILEKGESRDLFLIDIAGLYRDSGIQEYLKNKAAECEKWKWGKNDTAWIALLILAHNMDEEAIKKVVEVAKKTVKDRRRQVFDMPLQLAYVPQPQIVELLKDFLANRESYFFAHDVLPQYFRLCHTAAISLSVLLEGFPEVNPYDFKESDREKWLNWLKTHKQWKIKKDIVYPAIIRERLY